MRVINSLGTELVKSFESCKLTAYKDGGGVLTIGYGHTGKDVAEGLIIDQERANSLLAADLKRFSEGVDALVTNRHVSDNQFSAMVCFAFNVGLGNFKSSTLLRWVNKLNLDGAADEFLKWNHDGGRIVAGLTRRREAERALFKT